MAFLKITSGGADSAPHEITEDQTAIGRAPACAITVDDPAASGRHCLVIREDRTFVVRDLGSTNGTYLNGERITEAPLRPKDVLTIGSVEILIDGDDIDVPASPLVGAPVEDTVRTGPIAQGDARGGPSPFGVRRKRTGLWVTLWVVIGLGLLGLVWWFVSGLLQS